MKTRSFQFDCGKFWLQEEELPALEDGQVLVKTSRSLISVGTEGACNSGKSRWKKGMHGYSNVGVVIDKKGDNGGLREGDRVFSLKPHTDYFTARPDQELFKLPPQIEETAAAFVTLGRVAMHVVERAQFSLGQPVVVVGLGTVGMLVQQLARLAGATPVIGVDVDTRRHALAESLGADRAIEPDKQRLVEALSGAIQDAAAPVFIEVTGSVKALEWILDAAVVRSKILIAGSYRGNWTLDPQVIVHKELDVCGTHQPKCPGEKSLFHPYNVKFNTTYMIDAICRGTLNVKGLADGTLLPEEVIGFYERLNRGENEFRQPVIHWNGDHT